METIRTTCPRDCYDACGIRVVRDGGVVLKVMGDPEHPHSRGTLCGKCTLAYNGAWRDPDARLLHPLRRAGPKGAGRFVPISWDEALTTIAGRLTDVMAAAGGASVVQTHYTGTFSQIAYGFPLRFFHKIGATEVDPDTVCNKAGHVALQMTYGTSLDGFDPRSAQDAVCVLVWGANPSASAPHAHRHWLPEAPGTVIVVDPIRHPTAAAADIHLQPHPGSDAALAFAMLHVIRREGLLDQAFLDAHTTGWDEVLPMLDACTPAWGEAVTGVPAALIVEAARIYGRGPSLLWLGQGLQRQATGGNVFRACGLLPAATGNIGRPGAGFLYLNCGGRGIDGDFMPAPHLNPGAALSISHMDLAERLEDRDRSKALVCWNNNIVASCPNQSRLRSALEREELFTVAIDLFQTDTADYADIVLPAASFLEFDDLVVSYFNYTVSAQVKAMEPLGEALPNQEIFRRLAGRMGFTEPELFEGDASLLGSLLAQSGIGLGFPELSRVGTVYVSPEPVVPFAGGHFPTPSGKVEIAGDAYAALGLPRAPQPWADARPPQGGRLRLLSPASPWRMNSSYDNVEKARRRDPLAEVFLNPSEAEARGFTEGTPVILSSGSGSLRLHVSYSDDVPRGVALVHKGRWPKLDPSHANVNVLNTGRKSDMGESSSVHSVEVEIARAV